MLTSARSRLAPLLPALLAAAAERRDDALRAVIAAGPRGIWDLAARQLPPSLRPMLDEIRTTGQLCPS